MQPNRQPSRWMKTAINSGCDTRRPVTLPKAIAAVVRQIRVDGTSATCGIIRDELRSATTAMLGSTVPLNENGLPDGTVIVGTPGNSALVRDLNWTADLRAIGDEGYLIRSARIAKHPVTVIAANSEIGALYGAFHFLRLMQTGQPIDRLDITERPALQLRLMNHWDNPNGTIERGYAGRSLWQWNELPEKLSPRYADYARACASIGINGAVINNVNADRAHSLAGVSPQGRRARRTCGGLTACGCICRPTSPRRCGWAGWPPPIRWIRSVVDWWKAKADEIYSLIPDFGGFLVKANSEGQPGPKDLRPHSCRRRKRAGRCARSAQRQRHVARVCLRRGRRPGSRQARLHRVHAARRTSSAPTSRCR